LTSTKIVSKKVQDIFKGR